MLRTLEEIRAAGAEAVRNFPPLTVQQVGIIAPLINPALAMPSTMATRTHVPKATPLPLAA
jgi:hypothetical protein